MILRIIQTEESDTEGLASGYQRTSVTAAGAMAVEETGGNLLVGVSVLPRLQPIQPPTQPSVETQPSEIGPAVKVGRVATAFSG
jgi:hypothetical protein